MTTAILKYRLPEEQEEFELAMKGSCYSALLWSLDQDFLRKNTKYGVGEDVVRRALSYLVEEGAEQPVATEEQKALIEATLHVVRDKLHELTAHYEVSIF
jgi:hypothetical protein